MRSHRWRAVIGFGAIPGCIVDMFLVVVQDQPVAGCDVGLMSFPHQAQGLADQVHVVAEVAHPVIRYLAQLTKQNRIKKEPGELLSASA
jgi:hypothetical protein